MNWYEHFFEGLAADVWRGSVTPEQTEAETDFLIHHLRLSKGNRVLDVPCAQGRLAESLGQKGIAVTGVDLSKRSLESATGDAIRSAGYVSPTYLQADMRHLEFTEEFDGAFCMGNSFGYFDSKDTLQFLQGVHRALKPGAGFIIDTVLAAESFFTLGGTHEWTEVEGVFMLMQSKYDPRNNRLDSRFVFLSGGVCEEHSSQHYIFTAGEICRMCEQCDFQIKNLLASVDSNEPFSIGSERLLLHCIKPE